MYDSILNSYIETKVEYDTIVADLNKELTYVNKITGPIIADKKTYPIRWLIVLMSVLSANLLVFIIIIFQDKKSLFIE